MPDAKQCKTILVTGLLLVVVSGCHEVTGLDPSTGRPIGEDPAEIADGAPADAYESPRRDGASVDDDAAITDASMPTADAAHMGGLDEPACNACEEHGCRDVDGLDLYAACFLATGTASDGPGAGMPRSDLCKAVLHCARVTGCALTDPQPCYCGEGVSDILCLAGNAAGPCKGVIEVAAESTSTALIAERLADPAYASGAAFNLLRYCEAPICGAACAGGHVDLPDAGPPPDAHVTPPPDAHVTPPPDAHVDETLLRNPRFDHDLASWTAEFGASASWDGAHDALASPSSGSIVVANDTVVATPGTGMAGAAQCVPAVAGATYAVATSVLITPGQGDGAAGVSVHFFASPDCSGAVTGAWATDLTGSAATWTVVTGSLAVPAGVGSMRVRLVAVKTFAAPVFRAHFDNLLLERP